MFDKLIDLIISMFNDFKPIVFIPEYKAGVMLRYGKFLKVLKPGPYLRIPFLDDYVLDFVKLDTMHIKEVSITTLDSKTVTIGCEFDLEVTDIYIALVEVNEWRSNLHDMCQGILSDTLEDLNWEDIRKKSTKNAIARKIEKRALEMGITVRNFNFTDKSISRAFTLFNNKTNNA